MKSLYAKRITPFAIRIGRIAIGDRPKKGAIRKRMAPFFKLLP